MESPVYRRFRIYGKTTVKAIAFYADGTPSEMAVAEYARGTCEDPVITLPDGTTFNHGGLGVSITKGEEGVIHYTLDGSEPTVESPVCEGPFAISESTVIKAKVFSDSFFDSQVVTAKLTRVWGIGDALNAPDMTFTTSGDAGWVRDTSVSKDGVESMRSGAITDNQQSVLSGKVTGKGTLSFWWKTSCEQDEELHEWDRAEFIADGVTNVLDGITDWQQVTRTFATDGEHAFCWRYVKDEVEYDGEDCAWVDIFTWSPVQDGPFPYLGESPTADEIAGALSGSADPRLTAYLTTGEKYDAFRAWVNRVAGSTVAGRQAIKDSPLAWLSYALDTGALLTKVPVQGEMWIAAFEKNLATGKFDFTVAIEGIRVGTGVTAENLATILGVEGCATPDGEYRADRVAFAFGPPSDGKITLSAEPADPTATQFFIKVKMTP